MIDLLGTTTSSRFFASLLFVALLSGCAATGRAPVRDTTPPPEAGVPAADSASAAAAQPVHIVRPGDTLMGIGRLYGVSTNDLIVWNDLVDPNQISVGQELRVGPPAGTIVQPIANGQPVEVQPVKPVGDGGVPIKQEPKGGTQPYGDEAWAAVQPRPTPLPAAPTEPAKTVEDSVWLWPSNGQVIATFDEATNKGLDIAGNPGDPVIASAAGKVAYSGSGLRGYGKLVIIKHDANYLTAYAHNQELLVKEGESVKKGQRIAELGSTDADRPKLHFELRKQGRPVDPMKYLPAR